MAISGHTTDSAVIATMTVGTVLGVFAVAARLFTRIVIVRKAGWDDLVICAGCVFSISHAITTGKRLEYGMGQHYWELSPETKTHSFYWFWVSIWIYYAGLFLVKISILLQYLRVFVQKNFQIACYVLIALVTVCSMWAIFSGIFMCIPVQHFWESSVQGECMNRLGVWYSAAGVNAATDFATAILPLPLVGTLPISKHQKVLLMVVFGFGFCTCIVSVLRLAWIYPISITKDVTFESPLSALWSNVELNVGILCSCVPTLRSCMTRLFPSLFPSNTSNLSAPSQTKPNSSNHESKRITIQEIALSHDLEGQRTINDMNDKNDPYRWPFDFIACNKHESSEAVHLAPLRLPPTVALPKIHDRKSSLPDRVARWRESQIQTATASSTTTTPAPLPASQQRNQQYPPRNDSMKNLLCSSEEENEAILLGSPVTSPERPRDGC